MCEMYDKAIKSAMNMLSRREHSVLELTRKLQLREIPSSVIDEVIGSLIENNLLSDERFAESYVRMRSARGYGPQRVRLELQERGIGSDLIGCYLDEAEIDWYELANEVRSRKFAEDVPNEFELRAKQMRFLQYRGFSHAQINAAMNGMDD